MNLVKYNLTTGPETGVHYNAHRLREFQFAGVKTKPGVMTVPYDVLDDARPMMTFAVGYLFNLTTKDANALPSQLIKPVVGVTVTPAKSSSKIVNVEVVKLPSDVRVALLN